LIKQEEPSFVSPAQALLEHVSVRLDGSRGLTQHDVQATCSISQRALVATPQAAESMQIQAVRSYLALNARHFTVKAMVDFRLFREALALSWIALLC
jgi:hypothetical protein